MSLHVAERPGFSIHKGFEDHFPFPQDRRRILLVFVLAVLPMSLDVNPVTGVFDLAKLTVNRGIDYLVVFGEPQKFPSLRVFVDFDSHESPVGGGCIHLAKKPIEDCFNYTKVFDDDRFVREG